MHPVSVLITHVAEALVVRRIINLCIVFPFFLCRSSTIFSPDAALVFGPPSLTNPRAAPP